MKKLSALLTFLHEILVKLEASKKFIKPHLEDQSRTSTTYHEHTLILATKLSKIPCRKSTGTSLLDTTPRKTNAHGE